MKPYRNIISLGYYSIESKVFTQYLSRQQGLHYRGNFHVDSSAVPTEVYDTILININASNYRACLSFLANNPQTPNSQIILTSTTYFEELAHFIHTYHAQLLIKPIREDRLIRLINQPRSSSQATRKTNSDVLYPEYMPLIDSFSSCTERTYPLWVKEVCGLLIGKGKKNNLDAMQKNIQRFASLFIYSITQDLETQKAIQLTYFYNDLLQYFKMPVQQKTMLEKMTIFFDNCYIAIHPDSISSDQKRIQELKRLINVHFEKDQAFSLDSIAKEMNLSASYLSSIFKKNEKMTYKEYIHSLRLNMACDLLTNSNLTIEEVALHCGYQESSSFSRAFKKIYNLSPLNYRKKQTRA